MYSISPLACVMFELLVEYFSPHKCNRMLCRYMFVLHLLNGCPIKEWMVETCGDWLSNLKGIYSFNLNGIWFFIGERVWHFN